MKSSIINIRDFIKEGQNDSIGIANCLAACALAGPKTLLFSGGEFVLDEAIVLTSDTTVILDGCVLRQRDEVFDNIFRGANCVIDPVNPYDAPLSVIPIRNLKIAGLNGATIMGPSRHRKMLHPHFQEEQEMVGDYWGWRGHLINFSQCIGFEIRGLKVEKAHEWAFSFDFCSEGFIHGICFHTNVKNGDGIDFRCGCHHCHVQNITGLTMDDTVACTALYSPVRAPQYLFPLEPSKHIFCKDLAKLAIHDILIEDIVVSGKYHAVICLAGAGIQVHHITIRNIVEAGGVCRQTPLVDIYSACTDNSYGTGYQPGDIHHVLLENVSGCPCSADQEDISPTLPAVSCRAEVRNVIIRNVTSQKKDCPAVNVLYPDGVVVES